MVWVIICTIAKLLQFAIEFQYSDFLINIVIWLLQVFEGSPNVKIVSVLIILPALMNSL